MKNITRTLNAAELEIVSGGSSVNDKAPQFKGSQGDITMNPTTGQQDLPQSSLG